MAVLQLAGEIIWKVYCCRLRISLGEDVWMAVLELAGEDIWISLGEDILG